jgi:hypothetical protein
MAQENARVLKRRLYVDGEEWQGLTEVSDVKDEAGTADVPGFSRTIAVSTGTKKFEPLTVKYRNDKGSKTPRLLYDWFSKNENHDVTLIETDGFGQEINRWLLRDCECTSYNTGTYTAGGEEYAGITVIIGCTTEPVRTDA